MFSSRRHRTSGPPSGAIVVLVVLAVVGVLGWVWTRSRTAAESDAALTPSANARPADPSDSGLDPAAPPLDLPDLSESDAFVRRLVGRLSRHPRFARWLVSDELVRRFVVVVVQVAGGASPAEDLAFLAPEGEFRVREVGGRIQVDPVGYERYDAFTEVFASLDTDGTVVLYEQLHPLFEEAYRELGIPDVSFDQHFEQAVLNLLTADVPEAPPELWPDEAVYAYADPELEALSPAQKHLLRMGPENAARLQGKLREVATRLGIPLG